jgi:hypothetical protein
LLCVAVLLMAAGVLEPTAAQGLRGTLGSTTRYVEVRPLRQDTIPIELAERMPDGTFVFEGAAVACDGARCTLYGTGPVQHAVAALHEASLTAWGCGVAGLSTTLLLRGRSHLDGAFRLPHSDGSFEAVLAYAELVRGRYRLRVGRQRELSGLGASGFDGLDVLYEPTRLTRLQLYGGRSLARGLQQPLAAAFRDTEERDFVRDRNAVLVGGEAGLDTRRGDMLALRVQGEAWADRSGLLSKRALLVGRTALHPVTLTGSAEYDLGYGRWGRAHIEARWPLRPALAAEARLRRYVPFFEYWTIWGVFSPVAYHEAELRGSWVPARALGVWAAGAYRQYAPHGTQLFGRPLARRSVALQAGGAWRPTDRLGLDASIRAEGPTGAFTFGADAALDWQPTPRVRLSLHSLLAEQLQEFRIGAGVVVGGGAGVDIALVDGLRAYAGGAAYRQLRYDRPGGVDWTQRRGWVSLQWDVGRDPGLQRRSER